MFHLKKNDEKFNGDFEVEKFRKPFIDYELASEGWKKFNYRIDKASS